jgi:cobalamin biosynthesis protein CobT
MTYFIGIFTGILISFEYTEKYSEILYTVTNDDQDKEDEDQDKDDEDDEDYNDESNDGSSDSGDESNDNSSDESNDGSSDSGDESNDESNDSSDSKNTSKLIHEILVEQVRDTINTLYICTNDWSNFVSEYSICNRVQVLYPNISKNIIHEAMNMEPKYTTGSQYNKKGYRYIMSV